MAIVSIDQQAVSIQWPAGLWRIVFRNDSSTVSIQSVSNVSHWSSWLRMQRAWRQLDADVHVTIVVVIVVVEKAELTSIYVGAISPEAVRVISEARRRTKTTATAAAAAAAAAAVECLQAEWLHRWRCSAADLTAVWAMRLYIVSFVWTTLTVRWCFCDCI